MISVENEKYTPGQWEKKTYMVLRQGINIKMIMNMLLLIKSIYVCV